MSDFTDDDRKHLDQIQAVIARMAANQFLIKGWSLTVAAALLGFAAANEQPLVALLSIAISIGFWGLDAFFLLQERMYRHLWGATIKRPRDQNQSVPLYSLNGHAYREMVTTFRPMKDENGRSRRGVVFSAPLVGLYGMTVALAAVIAIAIKVSR